MHSNGTEDEFREKGNTGASIKLLTTCHSLAIELGLYGMRENSSLNLFCAAQVSFSSCRRV